MTLKKVKVCIFLLFHSCSNNTTVDIVSSNRHLMHKCSQDRLNCPRFMSLEGPMLSIIEAKSYFDHKFLKWVIFDQFLSRKDT